MYYHRLEPGSTERALNADATLVPHRKMSHRDISHGKFEYAITMSIKPEVIEICRAIMTNNNVLPQTRTRDTEMTLNPDAMFEPHRKMPHRHIRYGESKYTIAMSIASILVEI